MMSKNKPQSPQLCKPEISRKMTLEAVQKVNIMAARKTEDCRFVNRTKTQTKTKAAR